MGATATVEREVPRMKDSDKSELANKISEQFRNVMGTADEPEEQPTASEPEADSPATASPETEEVSDEQLEDTEATDEPAIEAGDAEGESKPEAAAKSEGKAPILPAAYRRSLVGFGFTEEEIEQNLQAQGAAFIGIAARIHAQRNRELQEWAKAGRESRQQPPPTQTPAAASATPSGLTPVDAAALKKQYGDEPLIDALVGPVNRAIEQLNQIVPQAQKTQAQAEMARLESLGKQVDDFFSGKDLEPFHDTYGTKSADLTETQVGQRQKVLELADALIGGARLQGRQLGLQDALQLAVDSATGELKEKAARDKIASSLKTRQRGISQKPGSRKTAPVKNPNDPPTRPELEKRVGQSLRKMFA